MVNDNPVLWVSEWKSHLSWYENWYSETSVMWPRNLTTTKCIQITSPDFTEKGFGSLLHILLIALHRSHCAMIPCYRYPCFTNSAILYVSSGVLFQPLNICVYFFEILFLSVLQLLMAWCYSTRATVAPVLIWHPCVSSCLWVNEELCLV